MSSTSNGCENPSYEPARMEQQVSMVSRPRTMRRTSRQTFGTSWSASNPGTIKRHRYAEPTSPSLTVRNGHSEFRRAAHNDPHTVCVWDDGYPEFAIHFRRCLSTALLIVTAYGVFGLRCTAETRPR